VDFAELAEPYRRELLAHCHRSSLRTWLYRIATNACLRFQERRSRRMLPSGLPEALQPIPDALFVPEPADPAAVVEARRTTRLALVAALQYRIVAFCDRDLFPVFALPGTP
jgi:RNA polymerase sigma-70 factor (ECF subfamily)